jgi:hypothetical protein
MAHRQGFRAITFEVSSDFYDEIETYCTENKEKLSEMIRRAVRREISYSKEYEILGECEKLINRKLEQYAVISVKAKKVK